VLLGEEMSSEREKTFTREFFKNLSKHKTYRFNPIQVVENEEPWEVSHEFNDLDVQEIYRMEKIGKRLSFSEAYRLRWLECARQDSKGKYWLMSGSAIRTQIWQWAKEKGYYIEFEENDFELQNVTLCV